MVVLFSQCSGDNLIHALCRNLCTASRDIDPKFTVHVRCSMSEHVGSHLDNPFLAYELHTTFFLFIKLNI